MSLSKVSGVVAKRARGIIISRYSFASSAATSMSQNKCFGSKLSIRLMLAFLGIYQVKDLEAIRKLFQNALAGKKNQIFTGQVGIEARCVVDQRMPVISFLADQPLLIVSLKSLMSSNNCASTLSPILSANAKFSCRFPSSTVADSS